MVEAVQGLEGLGGLVGCEHHNGVLVLQLVGKVAGYGCAAGAGFVCQVYQSGVGRLCQLFHYLRPKASVEVSFHINARRQLMPSYGVSLVGFRHIVCRFLIRFVGEVDVHVYRLYSLRDVVGLV